MSNRAKYIKGSAPEGLGWAGVDDPEAVRLAQTIEHPISGEVAMDLGYVLLPDGRAFGSTWREWGDVMVGAFGGHYTDYYMGYNVGPKARS